MTAVANKTDKAFYFQLPPAFKKRLDIFIIKHNTDLKGLGYKAFEEFMQKHPDGVEITNVQDKSALVPVYFKAPAEFHKTVNLYRVQNGLELRAFALLALNEYMMAHPTE